MAPNGTLYQEVDEVITALLQKHQPFYIKVNDPRGWKKLREAVRLATVRYALSITKGNQRQASRRCGITRNLVHKIAIENRLPIGRNSH